ncbi:Trypanosomal VSG domain containing protein, putative [Trypanosoma equiperdum]|uniref:Trypanosomal VSG domain containing protein, putative n=1 Tax=Trypanosoma equiperdum TaxID=5694 RepID=A0A1G4II47_TRYEQ|nr:Trypanosomal VSG domain containing protein, putative [Trypanosoma equiperdum]
MVEEASATIADGAKAAQFESICMLLRWKQRGVTSSELATESNPVYNDLQKLNLSLASDSWRKQFKKSDTPLEWQTDLPPSKTTDHAYKYFWKDWVKAAKELPSATEASATLATLALKDANDQDRQRAKASLQTVLLRAKRLDRRLTDLNLKDKLMTTAKIQARLNQAVYGKAAVTASDPDNTNGLGAGATLGDASRQANCRAAADSEKAATAEAVAICLCGKTSVTGTATNNAF